MVEAEAHLLRQAIAGDMSAFERFLLGRREYLLSFVSRNLPAEIRRVIEPQDVLQDVYFEAFRRIGTLEHPEVAAALGWLTTIARNRIIDLSRAQSAAKRGGPHRLTGSGRTGDSLVALLEELAARRRRPSQSAMRHELLDALQRSIQRLPEDYARAIRLRYVEGWAVRNIALEMDRTIRAVHMLCNRGLKSLRAEMRSFSLFA